MLGNSQDWAVNSRAAGFGWTWNWERQGRDSQGLDFGELSLRMGLGCGGELELGIRAGLISCSPSHHSLVLAQSRGMFPLPSLVPSRGCSSPGPV